MGLKNQSVTIFCKTTPPPKLLWGEQQQQKMYDKNLNAEIEEGYNLNCLKV